MSTLLLAIPIAALEVWAISRQSYWQLAIKPVEIWSGVAALITIPLMFWMSRVKKWALAIAVVVFGVWIFSSAWVAVRLKYPGLGFFTVGLAVIFTLALLWIRFEMTRSFLDPQLRWYEGIPRSLPGLSCTLEHSAESRLFCVSQIDLDGVFLVPDTLNGGSKEVESSARDLVNLKIKFRDSEIEIRGVVRNIVRNSRALGVQFTHLDPDLKKEVSHFIESLRGEGYVQ